MPTGFESSYGPPTADRCRHAALAFANTVRRHLGLPAVRRLVAGTPDDMLDNTIQRTIGTQVPTQLYDDELHVLTSPPRAYKLSARVRTFVRRFDDGLYPDLYDWDLVAAILCDPDCQLAPFPGLDDSITTDAIRFDEDDDSPFAEIAHRGPFADVDELDLSGLGPLDELPLTDIDVERIARQLRDLPERAEPTSR